jgi:hypothetical protein
MAAPQIVTRAQWGAASSIPGGRGVANSARRWTVCHWPVMSARDERQWCRDIERMHRNQGWQAAPGYNFLVGQSGTIYEGAGVGVRGIHSPPRNTDGWGICLLQPSTAAGAPTAAMSQAMKNSTRALYDWLCTLAGRRLGMSWHGQHYATACPGPDIRAWVQQGMPATGAPAPAPTPPQPPRPEEVEMIASAVSPVDNNYHVFVVGPARQTVWLTVQRTNGSWHGEASGRRASLFRFAEAAQGRTIQGIDASISRGNILHCFVRYDDGSTAVTWQNSNGSWNGSTKDRPAGLVALTPKP